MLSLGKFARRSTGQLRSLEDGTVIIAAGNPDIGSSRALTSKIFFIPSPKGSVPLLEAGVIR